MSESYVQTAANGTSSIAGRGKIEQTEGGLKAPDNIIMSVQCARQYYQNFRREHINRIKLYAAIEGLIGGNPPYPPERLKAAGLSHIANVNTLDAKALYERAALTFWNLVNQTDNLVRFEIRPLNDLGQDHDYSSWAESLSRNWTKVVREDWDDFVSEMNVLTGQLVKFGISPVVWPDERDFRWTTVDVSHFFCANETTVAIKNWDCLCIETEFSMSYLWTLYQMTKDQKDNPWNTSALESYILRKANLSMKGMQAFPSMLDMQRAIQDQSFNFASTFSDSVRLVSLFYKEYSEKISHYIFDPEATGVEDFLFFASEQYENFHEAIVLFTYSPGEKKIHGNRGVGHKIFPVCQALMQLDCSMLDTARMASTPIVKSNSTAGKNLDPIRFISGVATDIGQAEFVPNGLGQNLDKTIMTARYFDDKVNKNAMISGDDPSQPDRDRGSKSAPEVQIQAMKEFGIGKQSVSHFYRTLDIVVRQMTIKMLHCKEGYPCYDMVEEWKELCLEEGVPPEVFEIPNGTPAGKLPRHLSVRAARVAGDGSNLGLIVGLNGVSGIAGGFGQKGQYNYRKDVITSRLGSDYVDRYLSDSSEPDESGSGASVAQLENLAMQQQQMPQATKDNNHKVHIGSHLALIKMTMQKVEAQQIDPIAADNVFSVVVPHTGEHIQYLSQDNLNKQYIEQLTPTWRQINKFVQFNRVKAQKMMQAEVRRRDQAEQQMTAEQIDQQRKDMVVQREQDRKDFQAKKKEDRADEQSKTKADIMRQGVEAKAANEALAIHLKAGNDRTHVEFKNQLEASKVQNPQELLADRSTEDLQSTLASQIGATPNPADFS